MATITKRDTSWFAQIRGKGHKSISKSFATKGMVQEWTRKNEREIDTLDFQDRRSLSGVTLSELIGRYAKEMQVAKSFGRNKLDVLTRH